MLYDLLISLSILIGAGFALIGAIGLFRLPDFYTRLHGPTKATTLGIGGVLVASMLVFTRAGSGVSLNELLIAVFLFLTAPVSAHMLSRAALHLRVPSVTRAPTDRDAFPETE